MPCLFKGGDLVSSEELKTDEVTEAVTSDDIQETGGVQHKSSFSLPKLGFYFWYGFAVCLFYLVASIIVNSRLSFVEFTIDLSSGGIDLFIPFVISGISSMGLWMSIVGIVANVVAIKFKTKLLGVFNAVICFFDIVLLCAIFYLI